MFFIDMGTLSYDSICNSMDIGNHLIIGKCQNKLMFGQCHLGESTLFQRTDISVKSMWYKKWIYKEKDLQRIFCPAAEPLMLNQY